MKDKNDENNEKGHKIIIEQNLNSEKFKYLYKCFLIVYYKV